MFTSRSRLDSRSGFANRRVLGKLHKCQVVVGTFVQTPSDPTKKKLSAPQPVPPLDPDFASLMLQG